MFEYFYLLFCLIMSILSFLGKWKPNRFGSGMLWGMLGLNGCIALQYLSYLNQ
jgi:uncharacterized membrane protein